MQNELVIKISGDMHLEKLLELGEDVTLTIKASVVKIETYDLQGDGATKTRMTVKALEAPELSN